MIRFRPLSPAASLASLALVLAACGGTSPSAAETTDQAPSAEASASIAASEPAEASEPAAADEEVLLTGFQFDPTELTIAAGTEVTFLNQDSATHTVTEGSDGTATDDPIIDEELTQNGSTSLVFDEPGEYQITCRFHPSMSLTIIVEG